MLIQDGLHLFIHTILVLKPCLWVDHVFLQAGYLCKAGSKTWSIKGICVPWQRGEVQDQWDWIYRDDPQLFWPPISPLSPVNISSMLLSWDVGTRSAVMEIGPTFSKRSLTLLCFFTDFLFPRPSHLFSKELQKEHEWCYEGNANIK